MVNKKDLDDLKEAIFSKLETKFDQLTIKLSDIEKKHETLVNEIKDHDDRISVLEHQNSTLTETDSQIKNKMSEYEDKLLNLEAKLLEQNLRFTNLDQHGTPDETVQHFLLHVLNMPPHVVEKIEITKAFRIGKPSTSQSSQFDNRSILASFLRQSDTQMIMAAAFKKPKGTKGGVRRDLPFEWASRRSELYKKFIIPAQKDQQVQKPLKIRWQRDTLQINDHTCSLTDSWQTTKKQIQKK